MDNMEDKSKSCRPLIDILSEIEDFRKSKGKRHPLPAILALACVAMMCGYKGYRAFAEWGRNYGKDFMRDLGFTHEKGPCAATFSNVFRKIGIRFVEQKLSQWASSVLRVMGDDSEDKHNNDMSKNISLDGKTARGSSKQGSTISHFLSAVSHKLGITMYQYGVESKTNEIGVVSEVLRHLVLEGRVVTMDSLLTQRKVSQDILDGGGEYVMIAKENQKKLLDDVKTTFEGPCSHLLEKTSAETLDIGHGRIEKRHITVSPELSGYSDWPGLVQVFQLTRNITFKKTGVVQEETVYGITSLTPEEADPRQLMEIIRNHWHIENKSHWVRDVVFGEDHCQVRCGNSPQLMAALRNAVIDLMRLSGKINLASACREFAAQPVKALELVGVEI